MMRDDGRRLATDDNDHRWLPELKEFQKYDLYTKENEILDYDKLMDYYENLFIKYFGSNRILV